jgi:hypothetical protein
MNDPNVRTSLWIVRVVSLALLACVIMRAVPATRTSIIVLLALSATWGLAEITLRRAGLHLSGRGFAVLVPACSCALALGNSPGMFLPSLATSAAFMVLIACVAGLLSGSARTIAPRLAIVLFCGSVGAAWQAAAAPLVATFLIRN